MTNSRADGVAEFRAWVLEAYRPLLEHQGFVELARRSDPYANEFAVRIGNSTTVIEVQGIHWGADAMTLVFRSHDADTDRYGLPIGELLAMRRAGDTPKNRSAQGQHAQILAAAANIIRYAQDVLSGDFAALDAIVEQNLRLQEERLARAPSPQQRAANVACSEAGHAFKRGEYPRVVELLAPHLELLPPSQKKRYEIARQRAEEAQRAVRPEEP